jgi:hypothetical protein
MNRRAAKVTTSDMAKYLEPSEVEALEQGDLSASQRAMIGARMIARHRVVIQDARVQNLSRMAAVRAMTPKFERQACFVCRKLRLITQRHHILPVEESRPDHPDAASIEWLCLNCHVIFHMCTDSHEASEEYCDRLTLEEWQRIFEIYKLCREARQR